MEYRKAADTHRDVLIQGSRGAAVKALQTKLGITADGIFGPKTKAAVIAYQKEHDLEADGIAGPLTRKSLGI
ncbi:peptidoglycan-binding protein [Cellulomonas sp. JH27-2]|nr:peptidoglycan-binding protein [Cellulomonas sp. JH27-2]